MRQDQCTCNHSILTKTSKVIAENGVFWDWWLLACHNQMVLNCSIVRRSNRLDETRSMHLQSLDSDQNSQSYCRKWCFLGLVAAGAGQPNCFKLLYRMSFEPS